MLFSSTFFLLYFFPIFFTIYYLLPNTLKNYFIVLASVLFYAWGAPQFVFILLATIIFNFLLAHLIIKTTDKKIQRTLLIFSILINLSILLFFKYANFFIDNVNSLFGAVGINAINIMRIALPIGISFFTFHQLSFIIDVYRGVKEPMKKISDYALYILLFPQLIAGPIIRYHEIADQIEGRSKSFNVDAILLGLLRFTIGLAKKVLIANILGKEADRIFALPVDQIDLVLSWVGAITYTFQIYFDFSGYSDMAIGIAKMMGFTFPENFNHPYIAQSITEFWRRWHISLSRWMRDYLYIPLGGNKVSGARLYFNLWVVFLISGFWHGAEWTFILWGAYHGFFLAIERLFLLKIAAKVGTFFRIIFTFFVVVIGWVLFRSASVYQAKVFLSKMFSFSFNKYFFTNQLVVILIIAAILSFIPLFYKKKEEKGQAGSASLSSGKTIWIILVIIVFISLCIGDITSNGFNPFISSVLILVKDIQLITI